MNRSRTNAAAHARAWSGGSGDSESSKIATGTVWSAWCGFQLTSGADERAREEERRRLARDTRDREDGAGDDAADGLRQHDAERRAPACDAECERRFAQRVRHEGEHLHRRPCDEGQHQAEERERACEATLAVADDEQAVDEDADDDCRNPVQDVEHEAHRVAHRRKRKLVQIDRDEDADGKRHRGGDRDDHQRARECVRHALLHRREAERSGRCPRDQVEVQRACSPPGDRPHDDAEERDADRGREPGEQLHEPVRGASAREALRAQRGFGQLVRAQPRPPRLRPTPWRRETRRTIICALRFMISEKTSRIKPR